MMKKVDIYTDGACSGNPGRGGFGAILMYGKYRKECSGGFAQTTNNRMEIYAAIVALEALRESCEVTLFSDSKYLVDAVSKHWLSAWKHRGWKRQNNDPVLNVDLWQKLMSLLATHKVTFRWVKGHAENEFNNRCDELARNAICAGGELPEDTGFSG